MSSNIPPDRDVKDFEFIQLCKFRVSAPDQDIPTQRGKLLACSSQFGLVVYATKQGFSVVQTAELLAIDQTKGKERNKTVVEDIPVLADVNISSPVLYMDISCDGLYLAVVVRVQNHLVILCYDIRSFADKSTNPAPFAKSQVNTSASATISDLSWNPAVSTMLAVCTSDGNVELIDVTDTPKIISVLVAAAGATCFCWSPKGKQLLVGRKDGTLAQYDHTLAEKKVWPCPSILTGPHRVVDVVWQSTYVFLAAYLPVQAEPSDQPVVIMSSSNKENKITHVNFEDVCFGNGQDRKPQYFFHLIQKWDVILMASSNATETTIVGRNLDDKISWEHWTLEDCSRAELPLTSQQSDSFPTGLVVDYSPHKDIVISESKVLPPCPVMYLLSTDGMLVGYHLVYSHPEAAPGTTPALPLTTVGARRGVPDLANAVPPSTGQGFLQPAQSAQTTVFSPPLVTAAVAPPPYPFTASLPTPALSVTPSLPAQASAVKAAFPSSLSSTSTIPFSATASSQQLPTVSFTTPSSTTAAPLFPFGGVGSRPGTSPGETANQKQQSHTQAPPVSTFSQSGPSLFSFGNQSSNYSFGTAPTATTSSTLPSVGPSFSFTPAASGTAKVLFQNQPSSFGSVLPAQTQSPAGFTSVGTSLPASIFGQTQTLLSAKGEGSKLSPHMTTSGSGTPGPGQLHPQAPSAFTPKPPTPASQQGQVTQSPQMPGNGLVLGNVLRTTPNTMSQPSQSEPARTPGASQPSITPITATQSDSSKSIEATVDSAFTQNILEEIMDFEKELAELRARSKREVKTVGTREEMQSLRQDKEKMINFTVEINTVTKEQLLEVQEQKATCFNLLAMSEECQSRHKRDLDPHYHSLLLGRVLDPASAERLKSLQQMSQVVEQSVLEVDHALDAQWQEHMGRQKNEKRFYTPAGETVYKSIKNNHIVISSQRQQLEKLEEQLRNLRLYNKLSGREFTALGTINGDGLSPLKAAQKPDATLSSTITNGMTPEKVAKLREILTHRKVPRVRSTAPANLSMSRIVQLNTGRTPAVTSTTPPQLQHQTPQRPQQQRKHQLPHQMQTPSSPLNFQQGQPQPGFQKQPVMLQQGTKPFPVVDAQRPVSSVPTSFSGVAFLKHNLEGAEVSKSNIHTGVVPSHVSVMQPGMGLVSGVIGLKPSLTSTPGIKVDSLSRQDQVVGGGVPHSTVLQSHLYENITPTETEEDEDDDYDEEDNGYEDEEEEEDEDETGFDGIPLGDVQHLPGNQALANSNLTRLLGQQAPRGLLAGSGANSAGVSSGSTAASTSSGSIFRLPQTVPADVNAQAFTPLTTNIQTSASTKLSPVTTATTLTSKKDLFGTKTATVPVFGGPALFGEKPGPRLPSPGQVPIFGSQTTASSVVGFSDVTEKSAPGKDNLGETVSSAGPIFGGPAVFGEKPGPRLTSPGQIPVFGSHATPSKTVGFSDLSEKSTSLVGKDNLGETVSMPDPGSSKDVVQQLSSLPTNSSAASPSVAAVSSAASAFSFIQAAAGSETKETKPTSTSIFGNPVSPTTSSSAVRSVFGGKSPPESSKFSFGTTPSSTVSTGFTFGAAFNTPVGNTSSVFGAAAAVSTTSPASSDAEKNVVKSAAVDNHSEDSPVVGTSPEAAVTAGNVWGIAASQESSQDVITSSSASVGATTMAPTFGSVSNVMVSSGDSSTPQSSAFFGGGSSAASATSVFGSQGQGAASTAPLFGSASSSGAAPLFGTQATTTTTATASPFGTKSSSIFGVGTTTASVFGANPAAITSVFGGTTTTTTSAFGTGTTTTTTSVFGTGTTSSSVFASGSALPSSPFGGSITTATSSPFSGTGSSVFGDTSITTSTTAPTFGFGTGMSATTTPVFGASSSLGNSGTGGFGSGGGLFGTSSTTGAASAGTSVFGAVPSSTGTSVFGAVPPSTGTSVFGAVPSSTSAFSSGTPSQTGSIFGQTTTSAGFGFGQTANTAGGGGSTLFGQNSAFGQQPSSSSSGSLFGFGGLGGKPSEEKAKLNVFGSPQVFGNTSNQTTNLFGSGGSSSFGGGADSSSTFSNNTGRFSAAAGGVSSSGFGVTANQQTSGGFGAAPSFGSAPSFGNSTAFGNKMSGFGSSPSFGGSPSFGSTPTFSSPGGSTAFGNSPGGGFSGFANAAAPSFGQLAQASPTASAFGTGGGFGSSAQTQSPSFGGGFGSPQSSFGSGSVFGQATASPGFGGAQASGFGNSSFGGNPAFSSYRG